MEHKIVGIDECRCRHCQKIIKKDRASCPFCGKVLADSYSTSEDSFSRTDESNFNNNQYEAYKGFSSQMLVSPRSRLVALLLALFMGSIGAHRFYTGHFISALLMILIVGTLKWFIAIWVFIDVVTIALGFFRDRQGRFVYNWALGL